MSRTKSAARTAFSEGQIRKQLARILSFPEFQASERRRDMLAFVVDEALAGREDGIKATSIAIAVFDRGADFDQQADPVVRLEARKLRRDLDNYYAGAGQNDPIRISIPKGGYVPKFAALEGGEAEHAPSGADTTASFDGGNAEGRPVVAPTTIQGRILRPALAAAAGITVIICFAVAVVWSMGSTEPNTGEVMPSRGVTILVETFDARGSDQQTELIAQGLSHEVAGALLRFPDLRVHLVPEPEQQETDVGSEPFRSPQGTFVVTGAVWRDAGDLFVRAELLRRSDQQILWSERYAEGVQGRNLTEIQDEISSRIATVVGQQYGAARSETRESLLFGVSDPSLSSYACISLATEYRRIQSRELYSETRNCLEETVRREPDFARGWAMLAYLRFDAARYGYEKVLTREEGYVHAREAAAYALTLNPRDTDALKAMSHILHFEGDLERSIDYARRAVETNPNDPETVGNLGVMLGYQGRYSEAVPKLEFAVERSLSPAPRYFIFLAIAHMLNQDWDEMLTSANYAAAHDGGVGYMLLAIANANLGNMSAARRDFLRLADSWPALAEDPRVALKIYNLPPKLVDAFAVGLDRVRTIGPL